MESSWRQNAPILGLANGEWGLIARSLLGDYWIGQIVSGPWIGHYSFIGYVGDDRGYANIGYVPVPTGSRFPYGQPVDPDS